MILENHPNLFTDVYETLFALIPIVAIGILILGCLYVAYQLTKHII